MNPTQTPDSQPVDIDRLRELLTAATPGPWDTHDMEGSNNTRLFYVGYYIGSIGNSDAPKVQNEIDAKLIAAIRNAAPALLDELERLRGQTNHATFGNASDFSKEEWQATVGKLSDERDSLRRENEELKARLK